MTRDQIDRAMSDFLHYSRRYRLSKDDSETYEEMLNNLTKAEMLEVLYQIGVNTDQPTFEAVGTQITADWLR